MKGAPTAGHGPVSPHITPTGSSAAAGAGIGLVILGRSRESEITGNRIADRRPAATKAEPVAGVRAPISTPIIDAVTMKGSEVACNRPAATVARELPSCLR